MLVAEMPVVKKVLADAELRILKLTGEGVKLSLEYLPHSDTERVMLVLRDAVCAAFAVSWKDMQGKLRTTGNGLVDARHAFMYIAHKHLRITSMEVGRYIRKDHSTVLYACTTIKGFIDVKDPIIPKIFNIIKHLQCK